MKKLGVILVTAGFLSFILAALVWAQKTQPVPPPITGSRFAKPATGYNPETVETIRGEVVEVRRNIPKKEGGLVTMQLVVKTEKETLAVQVGPASYVDRQQVTFAAGDRVEVRGSRVVGPKKVFIIAAEIIKGGKILKLRDETGSPLWGKGKKQPGL